ncbi:transposase [Brachybacterium phenoliresistens]|uniref:Transposase n=1 Tax=Brachybacterium phenoliresistens TaxID=396014 RepID=Z9JPD4_9MICO|nr:IS110 family transposase [Brachybacterium phenoliresistens]EWS79656.1 transposase [Brachybacterium phenoliresistens]
MFIERTSVGLDVHARSVKACAIDTVTGEIIHQSIPADTALVRDYATQIAAEHGTIRFTYEAGPTGFELARALIEAGFAVQVAAPSKLLRPPGEKIKTDKNDALLLARLARNDSITPVAIPERSREVVRDLVRARDDARRDLMTARHRLGKYLLRHGHYYTDGDAWTLKHEAWMRQMAHRDVELFGEVSRVVFDDYHDAVEHALARRNRLDAQILALAEDSEWTALTRRIACLRGISTLTAFSLAVEIGDWHRFTGRSIAAYLGLVPSENSSGQSRSQGRITKTGNTHARRLLIEAAWHHKPQYRPGKVMRDRWAVAPAAVVARADAGNRRLHRRWLVLDAHKKKHTVANTAIARELAGWCWSVATMDA